MSGNEPTPEELAKAEPTPETLAKSEETGTEESVARVTHARRRSPAVAFLLGALGVGAVGGLIYFLLVGRAETPATPEEAAITDEALGLPAPDAGAIQRQVDAALREAPSGGGRAEQAAAEAQTRTDPEPEDAGPAASPPPANPDQPVESPEGTSPVPSPEVR